MIKKTASTLEQLLAIKAHVFAPVVPFNAETDKAIPLDFTAANETLRADILDDTTAFEQYINNLLQASGARYGYGGYNEHRTVYSRSKVFDDPMGQEPRRLHLGLDIWGAAGTPVMAPMGGMVHSFAFNDHFGDYGATIILSHYLEGLSFYTLYGHLALADLSRVYEGMYITAGETFAHFGPPAENGHWPPHLHLQVIEHIGLYRGDYPGVCRYSEREQWLANSPNPDLIFPFGEA